MRWFRVLLLAAWFVPAHTLIMRGDTNQMSTDDETATTNVDPTPVTSGATPVAKLQWDDVDNQAFKVGEKLVFSIKYEFVVAGEATMEIHPGEVIDGRPTIQFISSARSNSFVDVFFPVRDYNASIVDRDSLVSLRFHQNLREGHYKIMRNTVLNYGAGTFNYERIYKGKTSNETGPIIEHVSDILSSFFFTRMMDLKPGQELSIRVFSDKAVYPLRVVVYPKLETVKVEAGKFECLRVQPFFQGDAIFQGSEGSMTIWMTNDNRKMPVLIRSKVSVGAFDAELKKYETP